MFKNYQRINVLCASHHDVKSKPHQVTIDVLTLCNNAASKRKKKLPPPHDTEHCDIGAISQWYSGWEHVDPSPPQTPHESIFFVEPIFRSQPTLYESHDVQFCEA
jgi:hypothetical protein